MLARGKSHAGNNRRWMNCHPDEAEQILSYPELAIKPQPDPTLDTQLSGGCLGPVLQSVQRLPSGKLKYNQNKIKEIMNNKNITARTARRQLTRDFKAGSDSSPKSTSTRSGRRNCESQYL